MTDGNGKRVAMSHKCGELDKQVPILMGVSKAILENVIFCHQEESSWPLSDPASLKKKFDDIFESSRYSKALESIRKTRLEYHNKSKEMKTELASLDAYRDQADVIQKDVDDCNNKLTRYAAKDKKQEEELQSIEEEMQAHRLHGQKVREKKITLEKKQSDLALMEARLEDKISTTEISDHPEEDIKRMLESLRSDGDVSKGVVEDLIRKKDKTLNKKALAQENLNTLNIKIGSLKSEELREKTEMNEICNLATRLRTTHGIKSKLTAPTDPKFIESVNGFGEELIQKEEEEQMKLLTTESAYDEEVKTIREKMGQVQSEIISMEGKIQHDDEELQKRHEENIDNNVFLNSLVGGRQMRRDLENQKQKRDAAELELKNCRNDPKVKEIELEIRELDKTYRDISIKISGLKTQSEAVSGRAAEEVKITDAIAAVEDKIELVAGRAKQHRPKISELLGTGLKIKDMDSLRQQTAEIRGKFTEAQDKLEKVVQEKTRKDKTLVQVETRIEQTERSLSSISSELNKLTGNDGIDDKLAQLNKDVNGIQDKLKDILYDRDSDHEWEPMSLTELTEQINEMKTDSYGSLHGTQQMNAYYKKMLKKAKKAIADNEEPACGCCKRKLSSEEFKSFEKRMNEISNKEDSDIEDVIKLLETASEQAISLGPLFDSKAELESREQDTRDELDAHKKELTKLKKESSELDSQVKAHEVVVKDIKYIDGEVSKICSELVEYEQTREDWLAKQDRFNQQVASNMSLSTEYPTKLSEVTKMLNDQEDLRERTTEKSQDKKDEREKLNRRKEAADHQYHAAREEFDKLEGQVKKYNVAKELEDTLQEQMEALEKSKSELVKSIAPKKLKLEEVRNNLTKVTSNWKAEEAKLREAYSNISQDVHEFCRLRDIARSFEAKKTSKHRIDAEAEVQNTLKVIDSLDEKFKDYEVRIHEKQTLQSEKDLTVAGFEANLTILRLRREIGECKDEMLLIQEAIKGMSSGITELKHTYSECEDNKQIALQARAELKGKMGTIDRQVKELAGRLKEPNYRNVKERTRKKRVELETTGCAVDDLEKYWGALDKALLRFHGQKISDINRIIRELWQRTYCGEDIDGIEIVSGEEGGSTRAARSYNYRVVMRKGNTALDMRGRCSAGQRVLACLVIRLALAETFCINCGILTLDEPTTNLDEYNKSGLAASLADIISARSKQRNFQLIVITHDGDFVNHMRDAFNTLGADRCFNLPEFYWRICRNQTGSNGQYCSEIHRTEWDDM